MMPPTTRPSSPQSNWNRLAPLEGQRHEGGGGDGLAFTLAPSAHEVGDAAWNGVSLPGVTDRHRPATAESA